MSYDHGDGRSPFIIAFNVPKFIGDLIVSTFPNKYITSGSTPLLCNIDSVGYACGIQDSYELTYTSPDGTPKKTRKMYAMAIPFRSLPSRASHSAKSIGIFRSQGML